MTIYLDRDFRCHMEPEEGLQSWEDVDEFFKSKSRAFIEGYRVVPEGETWTDSNGNVFIGLMISPAVNFDILQAAQTNYEEMQGRIADVEAVQETMLGAAEGEDRLEAAQRFASRIESAERAVDLVAGEKIRG